MSSELDKNEEPDIIYVDLPRDLRPELDIYGIDEVDRGVCEDSYENRSILRANRLAWQIIYNNLGEPSGNIAVLSPEMATARSLRGVEDRHFLLVDERNPNSDYITEEALLIEEKVDTAVPLWVTAATRAWIRIREARKTDPTKAPMVVAPPTRCTHIKQDGVRCMLWCTGRKTDDGLCRVHLGAKHNNQVGAVAKARDRAYQAAPAAVAILEQLMETAESEPVKLKAATEILDRAGVRGGIEIDAKLEVDVRPAAEVVSERLARLLPSAAAITGSIIELEEIVTEEDAYTENTYTENSEDAVVVIEVDTEE
jgi:hypothetical protein